MITTFYIIVFLLILINEISILIIYGGFVSKQVIDVYMNLDERKLRINKFDERILESNYYFYISTLPFSLFSRYYISGLGVVPIWSKLHSRINYYFIIARKS